MSITFQELAIGEAFSQHPSPIWIKITHNRARNSVTRQTTKFWPKEPVIPHASRAAQNIFAWPDGFWCYESEFASVSRSDDYTIIPASLF